MNIKTIQLKKIQTIHILLGLIFFCTSNISISQDSKVVFAKGYTQLEKLNARNQTTLQQLVAHFDIKSISTPLKPRYSRNTIQTETQKEAAKIVRIELNTGSTEELIKTLEQSNLFEYVEKQPTFEVLYVPNDPFAATDATGQPHLVAHDFYSAWEVTKGDTNVVVGIVDTGIRFDHEDLQANVKYNYNDPIDSINNDNDAYFDRELVDNYRGWDMADWDNDPTLYSFDHGVVMAGISSATTDNGIGVAGIGYNSKYLPIKVSKDSTPTFLSYGYDGMIYGALQGCDVLTLSWGSPGVYSQVVQDYINTIVLDYNVVIVAAAGNSSVEELYYPASYENVVSVTGVESDSLKQTNSTYNYYVDVNVVDVIPQNTRYVNGQNTYGFEQGTSIAASMVSGTAALLKSHRPEMSAVQIGELLRVTGFKNDTLGDEEYDSLYEDKLGYFLNPTKALIDTITPSVRMQQFNAYLKSGSLTNNGDTVYMEMSFLNHLFPTKNMTVTLQAKSDNMEIIDSTFNIGVMDMNEGITNQISPFKVYIKPTSNTEEHLVFKLSFSDSNFNDYQYLEFTVYPTVVTSFTSKTNESLLDDVRIYPVPTNSNLTIEHSELPKNTTAVIKSMKGLVVFSKSLTSFKETIDVSNLTAGVYILELHYGDHSEIRKINIE